MKASFNKKGYAVTLRCGFGKSETSGEIERSFDGTLTLFGIAGIWQGYDRGRSVV